MKRERRTVYLAAVSVAGAIAATVWYYKPGTVHVHTAAGPQSQEDLQQIQDCLTNVPSYGALFAGDAQPAAVLPEQLLLGPFVALTTMTEDFYTGVVTTSLEAALEVTDMWIGRMAVNTDVVGAVVVGEDGEGFECVSFQDAAIGAAIDQFGPEDSMIWDAQGNAYFTRIGSTVLPIGMAAQDLIPASASLSDLQQAVFQRKAQSPPFDRATP